MTNFNKREMNEELLLFIKESTGAYDITISQETLIEDDLGVTGDDGVELIGKYSKQFNVDISKFVFFEYFNDEPHAFSFNRKVKPLTVGDLEKGIVLGKLDESVIAK